ncbi:MAG: hypothetical protein M0P97_00115 [Candidatus Moranbacteria bacterium]|jgi:hypothetical protein|nr:hypothetical protein [Candidatus Moranbacteria bacterium]
MNEKPIIILFKENELNISKLYALYALNIPQKKDFWKKLSEEEVAHAASISGNYKNTNGKDGIVENKFSRGVIRYVMNFVIEQLEKSKSEKISHQDALFTALRIERSMLEKKCFDIFTPVSETLKNVLRKLNDETEQHVEILIDELKKNKWTSE